MAIGHYPRVHDCPPDSSMRKIRAYGRDSTPYHDGCWEPAVSGSTRRATTTSRSVAKPNFKAP